MKSPSIHVKKKITQKDRKLRRKASITSHSAKEVSNISPTPSLAQKNHKKIGIPEGKIGRRMAISFIVGIAVGITTDRAVKFFDKLAPPAPLLPSGRPSKNPTEWLEELFGPIYAYTAVPGIDNRDFADRIHPDILESYSKILRLWEGQGRFLEPVGAKNLPLKDIGEFMLLMGGPVSNRFARTWQGYRRSLSTGLVEYMGHNLPCRWRFEYDLGEPRDAGPSRFIDGKLHKSRPQAIIDNAPASRLLRASVMGEDRLLVADWLVVSFVPNVFDITRGTSILDASDLHGQGNKAFASLLNSSARLNELVERLAKKGIRPRQHFQALYQVDVKHYETTTKLGNFHLVDVEAVKSYL